MCAEVERFTLKIVPMPPSRGPIDPQLVDVLDELHAHEPEHDMTRRHPAQAADLLHDSHERPGFLTGCLAALRVVRLPGIVSGGERHR
jgi:hypothetical protein